MATAESLGFGDMGAGEGEGGGQDVLWEFGLGYMGGVVPSPHPYLRGVLKQKVTGQGEGTKLG